MPQLNRSSRRMVVARYSNSGGTPSSSLYERAERHAEEKSKVLEKQRFEALQVSHAPVYDLFEVCVCCFAFFLVCLFCHHRY
jgi:hypothetical protein